MFSFLWGRGGYFRISKWEYSEYTFTYSRSFRTHPVFYSRKQNWGNGWDTDLPGKGSFKKPLFFHLEKAKFCSFGKQYSVYSDYSTECTLKMLFFDTKFITKSFGFQIPTVAYVLQCFCGTVYYPANSMSQSLGPAQEINPKY